MTLPEAARDLEKNDYLVALALAMLFLAFYVRTLAPDVLYADSAEFQCLAYTLGVSHSTGYQTYLLLGRLIGLLPIGNPAWRISLLSAVCAASTVGGVFLLARDFTRSLVGAALGGVTLGISYTFWSQAVIAEVYTAAMAFLVAIIFLLFHWHVEPSNRYPSLLVAGLLAGIGFGVHASVWLIAVPAVAFVLWTLWLQRAPRTEWLRSLSAGLMGTSVGLAIFLSAFFVSDWLDPPTSFIRTTLEPSRTYWKLPAEDFDSPLMRLKMTVTGPQWAGSLFPDDDEFSFTEEWGSFTDRLVDIEFPPFVVGLAVVGLVVMLATRFPGGVFYLISFLFSAFFILNYRVWEKNVFYLSLYIPLAVAAGTGMGFILDLIHRYLKPVLFRDHLLYLLPVFFFVTAVIQPAAAIRWQALRTGKVSFVREDYAFPVKDLQEPRSIAETRLAGVEDNAVLLLEWRDLFSAAYIAHVEKHLTGIIFLEAMPYGHDGKLAPTLLAELKGHLGEGNPIYTDKTYPGLENDFLLLSGPGNLYRLSLKK